MKIKIFIRNYNFVTPLSPPVHQFVYQCITSFNVLHCIYLFLTNIPEPLPYTGWGRRRPRGRPGLRHRLPSRPAGITDYSGNTISTSLHLTYTQRLIFSTKTYISSSILYIKSRRRGEISQIKMLNPNL